MAPEGSDSEERPWATLATAATLIPDDGSTVLVRDGVYRGRVRLNRRFTRRAFLRAENPYRARAASRPPGSPSDTRDSTR